MRIKDSGDARKPVPAGNYLGVVVGVYDLGTQTGGQFGDKHQLAISFELHKSKGICRNDKGEPLTSSKFYNVSFNPKATLRGDVEAILGKTFSDAEARDGIDVDELLEKVVRISIKHEPKQSGGIREVVTLIPADEDDPALESESNTVSYELDPGAPFGDLIPKWVQKIAMRSKEWTEANGTGGGGRRPVPAGAPFAGDGDDDGDDIPY